MRRRTEAGWILFFLAPYLLGLAVFVLGPMGYAAWTSLTSRSLFGPGHFVGLANYRKLVDDPTFWQAAWNTLYYALLVVPTELMAALGMALLLNRRLRGIGFFRGVYFLPFVLSLVSVGLLWTWIYSPGLGPVAHLMSLVGLQAPGWLVYPGLAMPAVAFTSVWRNAGYYTVIFLAGLQALPRELEEAASVDGTSAWQRFIHVTLPLLSPTIFFTLVIATIWAAQVFDLTYIMTGGGPQNATLSLAQYVYQAAFDNGQMGYASAISWALLAAVLLLTAVYFRAQRRWVHYG